MKRAVILHGTGAAPDSNWFGWLRAVLEKREYRVLLPNLPGNQAPDRTVYNDFLFNQDWDYSDNLIIGHSSGAVSILNFLMDARAPKIDTGVLVGAWAGSLASGSDIEDVRFNRLFPKEGFDFDAIGKKANRLLFVHAEDDPYCPVDQARWLAQETNSEIVLVPRGQHFSVGLDPNYAEFPRLIEILEERKIVI